MSRSDASTRKTRYGASGEDQRGATFDQTLAKLTDRTGLAEADMAELALDALFGERMSGEPDGKVAASYASNAGAAQPQAGRLKPELPKQEPPQPESPAPDPSTPNKSPANDDRGRKASRDARPRAKRQLAVRLTVLIVALVCIAGGVGVLQFDLGRHAVFARVGLAVAGGVAALAFCAYLHGLARLQLELHESDAGYRRTFAELVDRLDDSLLARADAERMRTGVIVADIGIVRDRLERIASSYGPAANRSAEIEAFSARIAALDQRVSASLEATRADLSRIHAEVKGMLEPGRRPVPAARPAGSERELPFDLFCDGVLALIGDSVAGDGLRRKVLDAVRAMLDTMFDPERLLASWERYRQDGAADFVAVYRGDGFGTMERMRSRLATDPEFGTSVGTYLSRYESLVMAASQTERAADLMALLTNTRGRCYTLLAHASGRIHSTEGGSDGGAAAVSVSSADVPSLGGAST